MATIKTLDPIDFEGILVNPTKGAYRCPYNCHRIDYPAPKWKTLSGFKKHMENCAMKPSAVQKREQEKAFDSAIRNQMRDQILSNSPYKIGDTIAFVREIVVKPTHETRGNRYVKVRYEPVLRYEACEDTIKKIDVVNPFNLSRSDAAQNGISLIVLNDDINHQAICETIEAARDIATKKQLAHDEHLRASSLYR